MPLRCRAHHRRRHLQPALPGRRVAGSASAPGEHRRLLAVRRPARPTASLRCGHLLGQVPAGEGGWSGPAPPGWARGVATREAHGCSGIPAPTQPAGPDALTAGRTPTCRQCGADGPLTNGWCQHCRHCDPNATTGNAPPAALAKAVPVPGSPVSGPRVSVSPPSAKVDGSADLDAWIAKRVAAGMGGRPFVVSDWPPSKAHADRIRDRVAYSLARRG